MYLSTEHSQFLFIYSVICINMDSRIFYPLGYKSITILLFRLLRFAFRIPFKLAPVPFCSDPIIV